MKQQLQDLLQTVLIQLKQQHIIPEDVSPQINLERPRNPEHGDFACNLAMVLAKPARLAPRQLAEHIINALPTNSLIAETNIAGPGFINFRLYQAAFQTLIPTILSAGETYGQSQIGQGKRIQVEFVSANPTGPLHVGHGRGAAYGDSLANILATTGYQVQREYYVNDAGRQMDILATSVWLRYLELCGLELRFPANGYRGDYIWDIAATLHRNHADKFQYSQTEVYHQVPEDAATDEEIEAGNPQFKGDKEAHIDALINNAKQLLADKYSLVFQLGLTTLLDDIKDDLQHFRINYDEWFSESSLNATNSLEQLKENKYLYQKEGTWWFKSTDFGDEKDRVVIRDNGQPTYFASDIAYHINKFERGFNQVINIWGADHHGYVPRVKAALQALGQDPEQLQVLLVQFAVLYRDGEKIKMSTRSGEYVTLRQLRKEVGADAARFFYVMSKCEKHMDFDLELAKSQTKDNPVYTIQYAHARICRVLEKCNERGWQHDIDQGNQHLDLLTEKPTQKLLSTLARYTDVLNNAATQHEPHQVAHYLHELAGQLHSFYDAKQPALPIIIEDDNMRNARLNLVVAVQQVLRNGLTLLGVSAPERM